MDHTTIQFPSMQQLWAFQKLAQLRSYQFDTLAVTLQASFTEDQLVLALTQFQGKVMDRQKTA